MPRRKPRSYAAKSRGARGGHGHGSRANRSNTSAITAQKRKYVQPSTPDSAPNPSSELGISKIFVNPFNEVAKILSTRGKGYKWGQ